MKKVPKLESLTINDYAEMMDMNSNRRAKYYSYLHSTKNADDNEKVRYFDFIFKISIK